MISNLSQYINLPVLAVLLAILAKPVVIKLGLRKIIKRITSLIVLNICTALQHSLTHLILFPLK